MHYSAAEIDTLSNHVTLINTFFTTRENQNTVYDEVKKFEHEFLRLQRGFVSSSLHLSLDGSRILNYIQWNSLAEYQRLLTLKEVQDHLRTVSSLAKHELLMYKVAHVDHEEAPIDHGFPTHLLPRGELGVSREV
jgi:hypothetical protein